MQKGIITDKLPSAGVLGKSSQSKKTDKMVPQNHI